MTGRSSGRGRREGSAVRAGVSALLTLGQVLEELQVAKSTFFKWRAVGKAPRAIKYPNGSLMIRRADLDAWIAARRVTPPGWQDEKAKIERKRDT